MKRLFILIAAIFLSFSGYFAYNKFKTNEFVNATLPAIKNSSLRVTNLIDNEIGGKSKITYKELLAKLEDDISEIDKRILEIQTITNKQNREISLPAVEYVKSCQVLARSLLNHYRKLLAMRSALDWTKNKMERYKDAIGSYSSEYEKKALEQAIGNMNTAQTELNNSVPELLESAKALSTSREVVAKLFDNDALIPQEKINKFIEEFSPEGDRARSTPN